ncbi:hypothetical protein GXW82_14470 [Streptacidiphilus sp. 4-A2]|nr:hypothetical protein [Streptacidiphilus sp. 4-A2]
MTVVVAPWLTPPRLSEPVAKALRCGFTGTVPEGARSRPLSAAVVSTWRGSGA